MGASRRIRTRVTKFNNRIAKNYPLLAQAGVIDGWMTTPEQQEKIIERQDGINARYFARLAETDRQLEHEAGEAREKVSALIKPEEFALLEKRRKILPAWPEYSADFWNHELEKLQGESHEKS